MFSHKTSQKNHKLIGFCTTNNIYPKKNLYPKYTDVLRFA